VPSAVADFLETGAIQILPKTDNFGRKVILVTIANWDPASYSHDDLFRGLQICLEKLIEEEQTQICGVVAIANMSGFGFHHARVTTVSSIKLATSLIQKCFPLRLKGIHFVRENMVVRIIHRMVQPFLKDKLLERVFFHGWNTESLTEHIPVDILPNDLGGSLSHIYNSTFIKSLIEAEEEYANNNKYGYVIRENSDKTQATISSYLKRVFQMGP